MQLTISGEWQYQTNDDIQFLVIETVAWRCRLLILKRDLSLNPNLLRSVVVQRGCADGIKSKSRIKIKSR
ncbi:hypothetical protein Pla52o_03330 [Novipirellula galeiformis]|uniref:Uncharacterized protein n=1 Tax=Novipirellula galeiformis TaxID=2528004 RepID=A0A5C6CPL8_9BACT|nr:hypothetical protein Pla52o_03330 [Novipirellula galeiformis]